MATKFMPVTLEGIEQGEFLKAVREAVKEFGVDFVHCAEEAEADGKQGKIVGKIVATVQVEYKDKGYGVSTSVESKLPGKVRTGSSMAFQADNEKGVPCLFAKVTGTDAGNPKQAVLCTGGGRTVDQGSGEIADEVDEATATEQA